MLTVVKNQLKVSLLSIKYGIMKEMTNKVSFVMNVLFMIFNNASFIIQWLVFFTIKESISGYDLKEILLLWGIASGTYGVSHFFFENSYYLNEIINTGKLDSYIVQPKNILISCITSKTAVSALGDIIYAYAMLFFYGFSIKNFLLLTFFSIVGGLMLSGISIIFCSLSFWFDKADMLSDIGNSIMVNFATYPDGIFKGLVKIILFTVLPVGIINFLPLKIMIEFDIKSFLIVIAFTILIIYLAFKIFYKGLKRYSSSNLMVARI